MIEVKDQMNRTIRLEETPKRIVSLVPSQTELLYYFGLDNEVVGITKFCVHPKEWFRSKSRIGGTKTVDFEKIAALNPDLIIANKEENSEKEIKRLVKHYPVYISDIYSPQDAFVMMNDLGVLLNRKAEAIKLVNQIKRVLSSTPQLKGTVLYLIWSNPYMVAGKKTYIDSVLSTIGLKNAITDTESRYPELTIDEILTLNPDYLFLSSEPYPFKEKDCLFFKERFKNTNIKIVDGEIFSWYGSRMLGIKNYMDSLIAD